MNEVLFITGATGAVGRQVAARLLRGTDSELYLLVHKKGVNLGVPALLRDVFGLDPEPELVERVRLVVGDVEKEGLGLPGEVYRELEERVTGVMHAAACTRFDLSINRVREINVGGTRRVLRLAGACRRLDRLGFVSTAFVAGKRSGTVYEGELEHECGFANSYEQSKYEAEQVINRARERLPVAVYRLSTLLGDSRTGEVTHLTAPHQSLQIMHRGLAGLAPGLPCCPVDLIPSDHAADALFELFTTHFAAGLEAGVFHITAGPAKSYTLEEILDASYLYLAECDPEWARRDYPKPVITSWETFDLSLQTLKQAGNRFMYGVMHAVSHFAGQLSYPKRFDATHLLSLLPDYERDLPHARDYYGKVVREVVVRSQGYERKQGAIRSQGLPATTDS
ncbi:MAG: SDR family oxidoreductase [Chloroflexia bacterium]